MAVDKYKYIVKDWIIRKLVGKDSAIINSSISSAIVYGNRLYYHGSSFEEPIRWGVRQWQ